MVRKYIFRVLYSLYIETIDFLKSLHSQPSRNPITDLPQPTAVETYFDILKLTIQTADEPLKLLTKSKVMRVRMAKEIQGIAQHEYTLVEVHLESGLYYFRIERTRGAQSHQTVEELKASDDCELAEMGNAIGCQDGASPKTTTSFPVTKPTVSETSSSSNSSLVLNPEPPYVSYPTKLESFSTKAVASLNISKSRLGKPLHHANDLITRVNSFDPPSPDVTLHDVCPDNLTWLEFILITNLVRSEDKLYSVFRSQCYLYSRLIFLLVQAKYCPGNSEKDPPSDSTIPVHISRRLSYADPGCRFIKLDQSKDGMAPGTWMSVLVTPVELSLLEILQSKFDSRWNETHQNVERWAEKVAKVQELEAGLWKKSQVTTGGPSSSSHILPHVSRRPMSTFSRGLGLGRTGPHHTTTWTGPPSFNSLRAPPPLAERLILRFGRLFKHK